MQFPYREMVFEWTGAFVHISEWEAKQPQINPKLISADPIALRNPRPLHRSGILVQLDPAKAGKAEAGKAVEVLRKEEESKRRKKMPK